MCRNKENADAFTLRRKIILLCLGILATLFFAITALTQYQAAIFRNVQAISRVYLEGITGCKIAHLENIIDIQFDTLMLSETILRDFEGDSITLLQSYIKKMQDSQQFDFFALVDDEGNYCSAEGFKPTISNINSPKHVLSAGERLVSFSETPAGNEAVLLELPIKTLTFGGKHFISIAVSINTDKFVQKMPFVDVDGQTRTSIVTMEGAFIAYNKAEADVQLYTNFFSVLKHKALMNENFTVSQVENDMSEGKEGMSIYELEGIQTFLYYAPVDGTNWYIISEIPYSLINTAVHEFIRLTAAIGIFVVLIAIILLLTLIISVLRVKAAKRLADDIGQSFMETDLAKLNAEYALERMAFYDELTGIPNKNLFRKAVAQMIMGNEKYAYIVLNIRKFKLINDLYGYSRGDLLLQHIAEILQGDAMDGVCARFSDDVFHLLLPYANKSELEERLKEISIQICAFPFDVNSMFHITVNFGVYVIENIDESPERMGDRAILALKKLKDQHTTGILFYNDDIRDRILAEQEVENAMHAGVNNKEFLVYFQPKYATKTETLAGAEALVRWRHPQKGLISPALFIPVFEKNGFISTLDLYVLEATCQNLRKWLDEGRELQPVSINQSRLLLYSSGYAERLMEITDKYKIPHKLIELEITESVFLEDTQRMISIMQELHTLDFSISMDDFGSGYSTLNMLKEIMVDTLKIDKDFFSESANTERGRTIVSNIIAMARDLNVRVVAEGVETDEQVAFLRQAGCDLLQGFYYSKPIAQEEFEKLIPLP